MRDGLLGGLFDRRRKEQPTVTAAVNTEAAKPERAVPDQRTPAKIRFASGCAAGSRLDRNTGALDPAAATILNRIHPNDPHVPGSGIYRCGQTAITAHARVPRTIETFSRLYSGPLRDRYGL